MRIAAGPCRHVHIDGRVIHVDRPLSPSQVALLFAVMDANGRTPDDVSAIEFVGEGPPIIEGFELEA